MILEQRRIYYMYSTFGFPKRQTYDIVPYTVRYQQESATIYLPSLVKEGDIIAVEDIHAPKQMEIFLPGIFFWQTRLKWIKHACETHIFVTGIH